MASWHTDHHHPPGDDQDCCPDEPGVRIRPVTFAELEDYLEQLANPPEPAPLARPRLVGITYGQAGFLDQQGRPGRSAMAEYRRRRAADWQEWKPTLALRIAAVLAAGGSTGLLTAAIAGSSLARLTGLAAAAALGWRLWFRPSSDTLTWRRGAQGERRTARLLAPLERHGYQVFHDLALPGSPANVDSPGRRPHRPVRDRLQTLPRPSPLFRRPLVAWPPTPGPHPGDVVVGGHPGRRDPRVRPRPACLSGAMRPCRPAALAARAAGRRHPGP